MIYLVLLEVGAIFILLHQLRRALKISKHLMMVIEARDCHIISLEDEVRGHVIHNERPDQNGDV